MVQAECAYQEAVKNVSQGNHVHPRDQKCDNAKQKNHDDRVSRQDKMMEEGPYKIKKNGMKSVWRTSTAIPRQKSAPRAKTKAAISSSVRLETFSASGHRKRKQRPASGTLTQVKWPVTRHPKECKTHRRAPQQAPAQLYNKGLGIPHSTSS
eukprot:5300233-Amphidinium_carterae.3